MMIQNTLFGVWSPTEPIDGGNKSSIGTTLRYAASHASALGFQPKKIAAEDELPTITKAGSVGSARCRCPG